MAYNYGSSPQNYGQSVPQQMPLPNQNVQPLFPQPQGNVYNINSTLEVANVPVGAGVSVALCMPEQTMFIKTMQNGNPLFYPYRILPFTNDNTSDSSSAATPQHDSSEVENQLKQCLERIAALEEALKNKKKGAEFAL